MKKLTKKIMAIMLSLVMILGCVPCFINEAGAATPIEKEIEELLEMTDDFPLSQYNAWVNENGYLVYRDSNTLAFRHPTGFATSYGVSIDNTASSFNGNGQSYWYGDDKIEFYLEIADNKLTNIKVSKFDVVPDLVGIYKPAKRIFDILDTVEGGFPSTNNKDNIPGNAWINNGNKMYVYNSYLYITHFADAPVSTTIETNSIVTPDNGDYIYDNDTGFRYTFKMTDNVLTSVEYVRSTSYWNGTYEPVLGTIAEVLATTENGFPTTIEDAWVTSDGYKVYLDDYYNCLHFVDPNEDLDGDVYTSFYVTPNDNNYKYNDNVVFIMNNKKLTSIEFYGKTYNATAIKNISLSSTGDLAVGLNATCEVKAPDGANYSIVSQGSWFEGYDTTTDVGTGTEFDSDDKITARKKYYKKVVVKAKAGYKFDPAHAPTISSILTGSAKLLDDNKYSFVIEKEAGTKAVITVSNITNTKQVKDCTVSKISIIGKDNQTYQATDDNHRIYDAGGGHEFRNEDQLDKMATYTLTASWFVKNFNGLAENNIEPLDNANIEFSTINDWIIKNPTLKYTPQVDSNEAKIALKVTLESKYIRNIELNGKGTFKAEESTNYVYEAPENANYEVVSTTWYTDPDCDDSHKLGTNSLAEDTPYYAKVELKPLGEYLFSNGDKNETDKHHEYVPTISTYDGIVIGYKEYLNDNEADVISCVVKKETPKTTEITNLAQITNKHEYFEFKSHLGQDDQDDYIKLVPQYNESYGMSVVHLPVNPADLIGYYVVAFKLPNTLAANLEKGVDTDSITKVKYNGNEYNVFRTLNDAIGVSNIDNTKTIDYLKGEKELLVLTNKSKLEDRNDPYVVDQDAPVKSESVNATIYKLYNFGKEGYITFSGLNAGNAANNISVSGNLDANGTVNSGTYRLYVYDDENKRYNEVTNLQEAKLEPEKDYKICYTITNDKFDINKLTINGQDVTMTYNASYPNEIGCNFSRSNEQNRFIQQMYITYTFKTNALSSGGGSSSYKAVDKEKTAEKITGTGKKGSKRVVIPQEGRKVQSVIVTDKKGNKVEVTLEKDGTYSFIQPASDVDVKVNYRLRLIELTIGSLNASVDDVHHTLDVVPQVRNDRTMLPIRFVAENLGAKVDWAENDPNTVWITKGDTKIEITLGSDIAKVNGKEYVLDSVAFAENDRTYLPVRFVSENLNAIVEWDEERPMEVKIYER